MIELPTLSLDWSGLIRPLFFIGFLIAFLAYGADKNAAVRRRWRLAERTLVLFALIPGGAFGALAGMVFFRHKTRKPYFWGLNVFIGFGQILLIASLLGWHVL